MSRSPAMRIAARFGRPEFTVRRWLRAAREQQTQWRYRRGRGPRRRDRPGAAGPAGAAADHPRTRAEPAHFGSWHPAPAAPLKSVSRRALPRPAVSVTVTTHPGRRRATVTSPTKPSLRRPRPRFRSSSTMTPSTAESTTIKNTNLDPRRPGDPCCRAGWNIRSDAAVIWRSPNQSEISHCTTRCRLMFVQRPGPILGSGLSAGPSPRSAPPPGGARIVGQLVSSRWPSYSPRIVSWRFSLLRCSCSDQGFRRGFSGSSAPGKRRAPVLVMSFRPGESSRRETPMIMKDPSGAARVNPVPLVDRVRIVLAADARPPMLKRG